MGSRQLITLNAGKKWMPCLEEVQMALHGTTTFEMQQTWPLSLQFRCGYTICCFLRTGAICGSLFSSSNPGTAARIGTN